MFQKYKKIWGRLQTIRFSQTSTFWRSNKLTYFSKMREPANEIWNSMSPETNIVYLRRSQDTSTNPGHPNAFDTHLDSRNLRKRESRNLKIMEKTGVETSWRSVEQFWKSWGWDQYLSNSMKWKSGNMEQISFTNCKHSTFCWILQTLNNFETNTSGYQERVANKRQKQRNQHPFSFSTKGIPTTPLPIPSS